LHTRLGTRWEGMETALDQLANPSIRFAAGGVEGEVKFLIHGEQNGPAFIVGLAGTETIESYSETIYWMLAEERSRPSHVINEIVNSALLPVVMRFRPPGETKTHFLFSGGDTCCEVIAYEEIELVEFASVELARKAIARDWTL
jgi:hypothetical protein